MLVIAKPNYLLLIQKFSVFIILNKQNNEISDKDNHTIYIIKDITFLFKN